MDVRAAVAIAVGKPLEVTTVQMEGPRVVGVISKLQHRPQPEHRGLPQQLPWIDSERIGGAVAGMHEILEVRLQGPACADLVLIDRRYQ
jgi:hypothetical protein